MTSPPRSLRKQVSKDWNDEKLQLLEQNMITFEGVPSDNFFRQKCPFKEIRMAPYPMSDTGNRPMEICFPWSHFWYDFKWICLLFLSRDLSFLSISKDEQQRLRIWHLFRWTKRRKMHLLRDVSSRWQTIAISKADKVGLSSRETHMLLFISPSKWLLLSSRIRLHHENVWYTLLKR
jgi:hypothetical protein